MQIIDVGVMDENFFMHVKALGLKPNTATTIIYMYKLTDQRIDKLFTYLTPTMIPSNLCASSGIHLNLPALHPHFER